MDFASSNSLLLHIVYCDINIVPLLYKTERFIYKHFDQIFILKITIYYVDLKNNNIPYHKYCKLSTKIARSR